MFRLIGQKSRWPPSLLSLPIVPLAFVSGDSSQPVLAGGGDHGEGAAGAGGDTEGGAAHVSPLTFGKVFQAIPRMTKAINTPIINIRIAQAFGLPNIDSSSEFKKIYSDGREALRLVNASKFTFILGFLHFNFNSN